MSDKPRVLIFVSGGVVQDVRSDEPIEYAVVDTDSHEKDDKVLTDSDGDRFFASAAKTDLHPDIDTVDLYWKQI
jgi:hypothetical protein